MASQEVCRVEGYSGIVTVFADRVVIRRQGLNAAINGLHGERAIPMSEIAEVELKRHSKWSIRVNGYIRFVLLGQEKSRRDKYNVRMDENAITFDHTREKQFNMVRDEVTRLISQADKPTATTTDSHMLDDLEKLANLRDKGILTQEEFEAKKKQILRL